MALATLSIDLVARLATLEKDMGLAVKTVEKGASGITRSLGTIKTAVQTVIGGAIVGGLVSMVRAQIDAIDKFNDLGDATGASIENISALDSIGRRTGTTYEDVSSILVKFNKALNEAKPDNDAGRVFKAMGLDVERLKQLDPAQALQVTAQAMQGFTRDGNLARATQELFGKSVQQAAPYLKDLAEAGSLVATTSTEQAAAAELVNKQLFALKANSEDLKRELVVGLLPAMSKLLENYRAIKELGSLDLVLKDAARGLIPGLSPKMEGDPGENINKQIAERTKLEKQLASAIADGRGAHVRTLKEEIATVNRYLEVLRAKQRTEILFGVSGDTSDAMSRRMNRGTSSLAIPKGPSAADKAAAALAKQGADLAESLFGQSAQLSPDFYDKWDKLSAAYKGNKLSLAQLTDAQAILIKQQPFMKADLYTGDTSDALSRKLDSYERARKSLEDLNGEIDRLADGGDGRKRNLTAQLEARLEAGEQISPETLDRIVRGIGGVSQEFAQAKDIAGDFASVFESGFEKAILSGEKLSDVIKSLGRDILQIGLRTAITQPLGKWAGNWMATAFSSFLPSFDVGTDYVPHDMIAKIHKGEKITPAAQNRGGSGSVTVINNWTVGDVASMAQVQRAINMSESRTRGTLVRSRQYGGAFA